MQFLIYISAMEVPELCAICKHPVDHTTLYPKGSLAINEASNSRKDSIHTEPGEKVHKDCRRKYCNPDQIASKRSQRQAQAATDMYLGHLRGGGGSFATDCFFCGRPAKLGRKRKKYDVLQVNSQSTNSACA